MLPNLVEPRSIVVTVPSGEVTVATDGFGVEIFVSITVGITILLFIFIVAAVAAGGAIISIPATVLLVGLLTFLTTPSAPLVFVTVPVVLPLVSFEKVPVEPRYPALLLGPSTIIYP